MNCTLDEGIEAAVIRADLDTHIAAESLLGALRGINRYCRDHTTPERAVEAIVVLFLEGCSRHANKT